MGVLWAGMVRELVAADAVAVRALLRERPLHNVFLESAVAGGLLGRAPGFYGFAAGGRIGAVMMIGPLGGTVLEVRDRDAYAPLASLAAQARLRPRHIVGCERVTRPFFAAYAERAAPAVLWERREPYYLVSARERRAPRAARGSAGPRIERAGERDFEATLAWSALQHREDLGDDRYGADPEGFRRRHLGELRAGRWWVLRERGEVVFQAHVGVENDRLVQIGGVVTAPRARNRGLATRGVCALVERLLERRPAVGLYCAEDNRAARRVYERAGFRRAFDYRSWLLDEPLAPKRPEAVYA